MGSVKKTAVELLLLGGLSIVLALSVNAVRTSRSIKPSKNYFAKTASPPSGTQKMPALPSEALALKSPERAVDPPVAKPTASTGAAAKAKKLEHDYQEIDFDQMVKVFNDPATRQGLNVFVDARKHEDYDEGHIPGALHCNPYEVAETIDDVVARSSGVERVIVYCGGGDCEDSIFLCRELVEAGVPQDSIFLYPGGWKEWVDRDMPVEEGHEGHEE